MSEKKVIAVIVEGPSDEIVAVPGTYKATWRFIEKEKHSLERHSNMHLIFVK